MEKVKATAGCRPAQAEAERPADGGVKRRAILVTAFEPFGGEAINPTQRILERLPDAVGSYTIRKLLLPVEFVRAPALACAAYDALSPAAVIMLGQAGGRAAVTPETTAKNLLSAAKADNAGYLPLSAVIAEGAPDLLPATLPIDRIIAAIRALDIPCEASDDAGSYVCNCLFYRMLLHDRGAAPTGFIHVPYICEQGHTDLPYLEADALYRAVAAALTAVCAALDAPGTDAPTVFYPIP